MQRITAEHQFIRYQQLTEAYRLAPSLFASLPWLAQVELEQFYQPHNTHTLESLTTHQADLRAHQPSLANKAGKHYLHLVDVAVQKREAAEHPTVTTSRARVKVAKGGRRALRIRTIVRPEIPYDKVARVLLEIAKRRAEEEEAADDTAA